MSYQASTTTPESSVAAPPRARAVQTSLADEQQIVKSLPALLGQFLIDQIMGNDQAALSAIYRLMLASHRRPENVVMVQEKVTSRLRPVAAAQSVPRPLGSRRVAREYRKPRSRARATRRHIPDSAIRNPHSAFSRLLSNLKS